jgi:hypothetical protein
VSAPTVTCPRDGCRAAVIRNHDEAECLIHGHITSPVRAGDYTGDWCLADMQIHRAYGNSQHGRSATRGAVTAAWSPEEIETWRTWQEGDPVPEWLTAPDVEHPGSRRPNISNRRGYVLPADLFVRYREAHGHTSWRSVARDLDVSERTLMGWVWVNTRPATLSPGIQRVLAWANIDPATVTKG